MTREARSYAGFTIGSTRRSYHLCMVTLRHLLRHPALRAVAVVALVVGSALITLGSGVYFDDEELPPFVIEKLPLQASSWWPTFEEIWLKALQVHVVAAAIALPGCLLLLSRTMLRQARALHRVIGRVVGAVVLVALVPSGAVLALEAKGGPPVAVGFVLSGLIVAVGMVHGIVTARRGDIVGHRRAVLHVLAQLSVAVTSRAMLFALDAASVDADLAYLVSLWLPVVASAWLVEQLVARSPAVTAERKRHEALHPLAAAGNARRLDGVLADAGHAA
jgi:uncharacterized membrane protein